MHSYLINEAEMEEKKAARLRAQADELEAKLASGEVMADAPVKVPKGTNKRTAAAIGIDDSNPVGV